MEEKQELPNDPQWVESLHEYVKPHWEDLLSGTWVQGVSAGQMTIEEMQGWMLQMYPFIHAFPKFLAAALMKVEDDYSRSFLINNIRVEKAHAEHWMWMGVGFGLRSDEMLELAEGHKPVLSDVQSLTDWLWYINTKGSLAEAVAATSFAVEGATGALARKVMSGFESYKHHPHVDFNPKTYKWMKEHARYDDEHPKIALEIVKRYAVDDSLQTRVMLATSRSLQLLHQALLTSYRAYAVGPNPKPDRDLRTANRRKEQLVIAFPDRRFREGRRGPERVQ